MSTEVKVPNLPESVSEATVATWHKKAGDKVRRDDNLVDLETDKVMLEVPAVADGVLKEIRIEAGATVKAGDIIAILAEGEGGGTEEKPAASAEPKSEPAPEPAPKAAARRARRKCDGLRPVRLPSPVGRRAAAASSPTHPLV